MATTDPSEKMMFTLPRLYPPLQLTERFPFPA